MRFKYKNCEVTILRRIVTSALLLRYHRRCKKKSLRSYGILGVNFCSPFTTKNNLMGVAKPMFKRFSAI